MNMDPIWLPVFGMALLTAIVWVKLYVDRLTEMRARGVAPQRLATARAGTVELEKIGAADNFRNLFEVPVLFYVLCIALVVTGASSPGFVAAAWGYVALRTLHSAIHVTYNRVVHRFLVYVASTLLLFGMWAAFFLKVQA